MKYHEATMRLPDDAVCTACFGNMGEAKCTQYWRANGGRDLYEVNKLNGEWTCKKQVGAGLWYEMATNE